MFLVTGANGFVGTALCAELAARRVPFRGATRTAMPGGVAVGNLGPETDWRAALAGAETVIHLAARVHVMRETADDAEAAYRRTNVEGTLALARAAAAAGARRLVFLSSIKVNGEGTAPGHPFTADDAADPRDPYARSKLAAEEGLFAVARDTGLEVVVVRPPLVYGPGVKANFRQLMGFARRGVPLPLGAVDNRRSFVFVGNLCDLLIAAATHPAAAGQRFLVSDGADLSTADLLRRLARAAGRGIVLPPLPAAILRVGAKMLGRGDLAQRLLGSLEVDIGKTRQLLGWSPPVSVDEGLRRTMAAR